MGAAPSLLVSPQPHPLPEQPPPQDDEETAAAATSTAAAAADATRLSAAAAAATATTTSDASTTTRCDNSTSAVAAYARVPTRSPSKRSSLMHNNGATMKKHMPGGKDQQHQQDLKKKKKKKKRTMEEPEEETAAVASSSSNGGKTAMRVVYRTRSRCRSSLKCTATATAATSATAVEAPEDQDRNKKKPRKMTLAAAATDGRRAISGAVVVSTRRAQPTRSCQRQRQRQLHYLDSSSSSSPPVVANEHGAHRKTRVSAKKRALKVEEEEERRKKKKHKTASLASASQEEDEEEEEELLVDGAAVPKHEWWDAVYQRLVQFKDQHGHCDVPRQSQPKLSNWIHTQRKEYNHYMRQPQQQQQQSDGNRNTKNKRKCKINAEQIDLLNAIGFNWGTQKQGWDYQFAQIQEYYRRHGHCNIPAIYEPNPSLGFWVQTQRKLYNNKSYGGEKKKKADLTPDHIRQLNSIGFDWGTSQKDRWEARFVQLQQYKDKYGHCCVPSTYKATPSLGNWVKNQRALYNKKRFINTTSNGKKMKKLGELTQQRIDRLDGIEFEWTHDGQRSSPCHRRRQRSTTSGSKTTSSTATGPRRLRKR